jgi:Tfp pilus assembly protein PilV
VRDRKNFLIGALVLAVVLMSVGYAALANMLDITGTAEITSRWDVRFTNISQGTSTGSATQARNPSYLATSATFDVIFTSPGDSMAYDITITNNGTLDARLASYLGVPAADDKPIQYSVTGINQGDTIAAGASRTITVRVEYAAHITSQPEAEDLTRTLTLTLNFTQA